MIGTRHRDINSSSTILANNFRSRSRSIRDDVLVIDKQSVLIVSDKEFLECQGIRFCVLMALRMREVLEEAFRSEDGEAVTKEVKKVLFSVERPSVTTNSVNYQVLWPVCLEALRVVQWAQNLEAQTKTQSLEGELMRALVKKISTLESQIEWFNAKTSTVVDLANVTLESALNHVRSVLESIVNDIYRYCESPKSKVGTLYQRIEYIRSQNVVPIGIANCMHVVRAFGNKGSHGSDNKDADDGLELRMTAVVLVLSAMAQLFEWYVASYLPSTHVQCPQCDNQYRVDAIFCRSCGASLRKKDRRKCEHEFEYDDNTHFCPTCGTKMDPP